MIDIKLIREDKERVKIDVRKKGYDAAIIDRIFDLDVRYRECARIEQTLQHERQEHDGRTEEGRAALKDLKAKINDAEKKRILVEKERDELLFDVPNLPDPSVAVGPGESANRVIRTWGDKPKFGFEPKDHFVLGNVLKIFDFDAGAKIAGSQFYYLDGDGALLEFALIQYGLDALVREGFMPTITPDLARSEFYRGTGYMPKGDEGQTYVIEGEDLGLIATAEVTLAGRHADTTFDRSRLPVRYAGVSHCFRKEAGAYGKYSKGLYRVHQFTKMEMFVICVPEESGATHERLLDIEERIWQGLKIPYQVIQMGSGDLGSSAAKKYDIEAWMPGRGEYGEVTSTSNCTDYQSRNFRISVKNKEGKNEFTHMLNGTALAISRAIIAVLENYQQADGSVRVPDALIPYMHGVVSITPKL